MDRNNVSEGFVEAVKPLYLLEFTIVKVLLITNHYILDLKLKIS